MAKKLKLMFEIIMKINSLYGSSSNTRMGAFFRHSNFSKKIRNLYSEVGGSDFRGKAIVMGALTLYLDFINLFLFLLRLMGERR